MTTHPPVEGLRVIVALAGVNEAHAAPLAQILGAQGHEVVAVHSPVELLRQLAAKPTDLAVISLSTNAVQMEMRAKLVDPSDPTLRDLRLLVLGDQYHADAYEEILFQHGEQKTGWLMPNPSITPEHLAATVNHLMRHRSAEGVTL